MGTVAWPSGRGGFGCALSHHVHFPQRSLCASQLQRREDFFQNRIQEKHPAANRRGRVRFKTGKRVFVRGCPGRTCGSGAAAAPRKAASAPSMRSSNESAGLQGYNFSFHPIAISQVSWRKRWLQRVPLVESEMRAQTYWIASKKWSGLVPADSRRSSCAAMERQAFSERPPRPEPQVRLAECEQQRAPAVLIPPPASGGRAEFRVLIPPPASGGRAEFRWS